MKTIEVDDDLYAYIASQTQVIGESAGDILRRLLGLTEEAEPPLSLRSQSLASEHELTNMLQSRVLRFKPVVEQFLQILGEAARQKPETFKNVLRIQGRGRKYFAEEKAEIEASGTSTQPKQIPGTEYWVMTNSPTPQKATMLRQALEVIGFSEQAAQAAADTISGK
jgi:negative modulator of initiation of replication